MPLIDLSVVVNEQTPVYPGDPAARIEPVGRLEKEGFVDHFVSIDTHLGTHIDAPLHMLKGGRSLDQFPVDTFVGRGCYIKVSGDFDIEDVKKAAIQEGDIVVFHTGMSDHFYEPLYYEKYPAMSEEIARYLIKCRVKMIGLDTGSADNVGGFPIHKILLSSGVLIIENLTNLTSLQNVNFTIYALPIKLQLDGSPARVIADINEEGSFT